MDLVNVDFTLHCESALLFHADDVESADLLTAWRKATENKNVSVPGDDRSPAWAWQTYLYHDGSEVVWPSANLMTCLRQAGAQMILKRTRSYKELTQSGLVPEQEWCRFEGPAGVIPLDQILALHDLPFKQQADKVKDFGLTLYVKRCKIGRNKHIRVRPRAADWTIKGSLKVLATELTLPVIRQLFELAGRAGLGDWRPACSTPGPFGRFHAEVEAA